MCRIPRAEFRALWNEGGVGVEILIDTIQHQGKHFLASTMLTGESPIETNYGT